jgi:tetratricopeptide (TPR) repeat protein
MPRRIPTFALSSLLVWVAACETRPEASRTRPATTRATLKAAPKAKPRASAEVAKPLERPKKPRRGISAMAVQEANALERRFKAPQGTPLCDADALARLQLLRSQHGAAGPIRKALLAAYEGCDERVARARLLHDTLGERPTHEDRLELGVAWLQAMDYGEAIRQLEPLAEEGGDDSEAAWVLGMAYAYSGRPDAALPRLRKARHHARGPKGADGEALIALCLLELDRVAEAVETLEKGLQQAPKYPPLLSLGSRAYTAAGQPGKAAEMAALARDAHDKLGAFERQRGRYDAKRRSLNAAWRAERFDEVELLIADMMDEANDHERLRLYKNQLALYERQGKAAKAAASRRKLAALSKKLGGK